MRRFGPPDPECYDDKLRRSNACHCSHGLPRIGQDNVVQPHSDRTHGKHFAVIVKEFGEVGIDNDLIVNADEEIFEMSNGCIPTGLSSRACTC